MSNTDTSFTFRLPKPLHKAARIKSVETKRSLNDVLVEKLKEWLDEDKTPDTKKRVTKTQASAHAS